MKPYIVTTGATAGRCVLIGYSDTPPIVGEEHRLERARMVLYWPEGCGGLFGLAADGPVDGLRLTSRVKATTFSPVREVIEIEEEAANLFEEWPDFKG